MRLVQFVSILKFVQVKFMKAEKIKNMTNKEFQHFRESQFVSIVNLDQKTLMQIIHVIQRKKESENKVSEDFGSTAAPGICDKQLVPAYSNHGRLFPRQKVNARRHPIRNDEFSQESRI
jgi:hypothetical protein